MFPSGSQRETANRLMSYAAIAGSGWAAAQTLMMIIPYSAILSAVGNGLVFGAYAGIMYSVRGGALNICRCAVIAALGVTHIVWLFPLTDLITPYANAAGLDEWASMLCVTSIVLGLAITAISWRWWMILAPIASLAAAIGMLELQTPGVPSLWNLLGTGAAIGMLHVGLLTSLVIDTLKEVNRRWPLLSCANCGYNLRNLPSPICPECGRSSDRPPTHP